MRWPANSVCNRPTRARSSAWMRPAKLLARHGQRNARRSVSCGALTAIGQSEPASAALCILSVRRLPGAAASF